MSVKQIRKGDTIHTPFGTYEILTNPKGKIGEIEIKGTISDCVFLSNKYCWSEFESEENAERFYKKVNSINKKKALSRELG